MMDRKKRKRLLYIMVGAALILAFFLILNSYLAKKLEDYLREELVIRTSDATNGFYNLAFEGLFINILNGELSMTGIRLQPDPAVLSNWQQKDSLPPIYARAQVEKIEFKGVNLIWRRNYKQLSFRTFEIKRPVIHIVHSQYTEAIEVKPKGESKTLYEMISPYINVLSVKKMNLKNASIFYDVENDTSPVHYELDDVTFHAYGFRLDENSYSNGKLLYSDNFDFTTNKSQTILINNQMIFSTDTVSLDTRKKVVHIGNAILQSQDKLWEKGVARPDHIMSGKIDRIRIEGIEFKRKDSKNSLIAGSLEVVRPDVKGSSVMQTDTLKPVKKEEDNYINADSLLRRMSLYSIVAPIFHDITVNSIGINKARMEYTLYVDGSTDVYSLEQFDFKARGFSIDSLTTLTGPSRYYKFISFEATDMKGRIPSRNQTIDLKKVSMDTEEERLYIEHLNLGTLSKEKHREIFSGKIDTVSLEGMNIKNGISARLFSIRGVDLDYHISPDTTISLEMPVLTLSGLALDSEKKEIKLNDFHINTSNIRFHKTSKPTRKTDIRFNHLNMNDLVWDANGYKVDSVDFNMEHLYSVEDGQLFKRVNDTLVFKASGVSMNNEFKDYKARAINLHAVNLAIPVDNGFYMLKIGQIDLNNGDLSIDRLHYQSTYPQMEFSYKHPKHSDWFDIEVGHLAMNGIDMQSLFKDTLLKAQEVTVNDMTLQNMKNQKIELPRRMVPMVYEGIQKAPVKIDIPMVRVNNFAVIYYELAKKGVSPGKLSITDVTGTITGLTNRATQPEQFFTIQADAKFMGSGNFNAIWRMPVEPAYDRFQVEAHLHWFNLEALNPFISPLAGAQVESGIVQNVRIWMDASSKEGTIKMQLPYRDLKIDLDKAFITWLANTAIRSNNPADPDKPDSELRESYLTITRNPYHSTFNYLWQMISPALIESVGIPRGTQKFGKGVSKAIQGIKDFFSGNKDDNEKDKK